MIDVDMTVDEALANADDWMEGQTFYPGSVGWHVICAVLAEEVRRLRAEKWTDVKDGHPDDAENVLCVLKSPSLKKTMQIVGYIEDGVWLDTWLCEEIENTWWEVAMWKPLQEETIAERKPSDSKQLAERGMK